MGDANHPFPNLVPSNVPNLVVDDENCYPNTFEGQQVR